MVGQHKHPLKMTPDAAERAQSEAATPHLKGARCLLFLTRVTDSWRVYRVMMHTLLYGERCFEDETRTSAMVSR